VVRTVSDSSPSNLQLQLIGTVPAHHLLTRVSQRNVSELLRAVTLHESDIEHDSYVFINCARKNDRDSYQITIQRDGAIISDRSPSSCLYAAIIVFVEGDGVIFVSVRPSNYMAAERHITRSLEDLDFEGGFHGVWNRSANQFHCTPPTS
jgi:hypothetical protein